MDLKDALQIQSWRKVKSNFSNWIMVEGDMEVQEG